MASVRFSRKALADLAAIHAWLAQRNPAAAGRVVAAIEHSAGLLGDQPKLGRREEYGLGRILIVPRFRYVIAYRHEGDWVRSSTSSTRGDRQFRPRPGSSPIPRVNP